LSSRLVSLTDYISFLRELSADFGHLSEVLRCLIESC